MIEKLRLKIQETYAQNFKEELFEIIFNFIENIIFQ